MVRAQHACHVPARLSCSASFCVVCSPPLVLPFPVSTGGLKWNWTNQRQIVAALQIDGAKRVALEERYLASGVCEAVLAGNADVARMLVLSALLGQESLASA